MGYLNYNLEKKAFFSVPATIGGIVSYKKQKEGDSTDKLISALGQGLATGAGSIAGGGLAGLAIFDSPLAKAIERIKNKKLATALEMLIGGGSYVGGGVLGHKALDWLGYND
jgi:hypothetical protein